MIKTRYILLATLILIGFWVAGFVIKAHGLGVVKSGVMQPFGYTVEGVTAQDTLQPTYSPEVTLNGQYLQGSTPELQGK